MVEYRVFSCGMITIDYIRCQPLIFQYRDIVIEVCHILQKHHPLVKPMTFVGQSSTGKQSKGFTQKQQLKVSKRSISFFEGLMDACRCIF